MRGRGPPAFAAARAAAHTSASSSNSLHAILARARAEGSLNLSNRALRDAPPEIFSATLGEGEKFWELVPLQKLDLSFNELRVIPPEVGLLADLLSLKLRHNLELQSLPSEFYDGCTSLRHLDIAQNKFTTLYDGLGNLRDLRELVASQNRLQGLPVGLHSCQNLQLIDVSGNNLTRLPECFRFPALQSLIVSQNSLVDLPAQLSECFALELLDCKGNKLRALPDLSRLDRLKRIDAMENKIAVMPNLPSSSSSNALSFVNLCSNSLTDLRVSEVLQKQRNLTELHVAGNLLKEVPDSISACVSLKLLDVSNNQLSDLPSVLGSMTSLRKIMAAGNAIRCIRQSLLSSQALDATEKLKESLRNRAGESGLDHGGAPHSSQSVFASQQLDDPIHFRIRESTNSALDLSSLNIVSLSAAELLQRLQAAPHITDSASGKISLTHLDLSSNKLKGVPFELAELPVLSQLNLSKCVELGKGEGGGTLPCTLTSLDISKCSLSSTLLGGMISSTRLQVLIAAGNALTSIPPCFARLVHLRELNLQFNRLTSIEDVDWAQLIALETLNLADNRISSIKPLERMPHASCSLKTLMLDNNELSEIPSFLCRWGRLQSLTLYGNPQRGIRGAVLDKGTLAILDFLRLRES